MKKVVIRFGLIGSAFTLIFFLVNWLLSGSNNGDYSGQEIIGYAGIVLSMLFVFGGIRYYRDKVNDGQITFSKALKLGCLIALFPSAAFALLDLVYILFINPDFMEQYYKAELNKMKATLSAAAFEEKRKALENEKQLFSNPAMNVVLMFLTAFIVGMICTIISALILKRSPRSVSPTPTIRQAERV